MLQIQWLVNICHSVWLTATSSYTNILLIFLPLGTIAGVWSWNPTTVFVLNFLAIIPLSVILTFVLAQQSIELAPAWKGVLGAMFTNSVKLIINVIAVNHSQIRIARSCILGSILSNILFVLGCCFLASGIRNRESNFNITTAQTMSSLMVVASFSLFVPSTIDVTLYEFKPGSRDMVLVLSRGTAVILLILYTLYLYFRLNSHASLFNDQQALALVEERQPSQKLSPLTSSVALVIVMVLVANSAHFLMGSVDSLVETRHLSKTFIGLVLLPILGNGKERIMAISAAYRGMMDDAIDVTIGGSIQIALFVTPLLVILSWIMKNTVQMTLQFESFETIVFFMSVLVVNSLVRDGKSNYLEGCMCLGTYIIIAIAFRLYPDSPEGHSITEPL